jgi:hypothetical protein
MNRIQRYRLLAVTLAVFVAGATAPSVLMAQGSPSFASYGHSHKKHKKHEMKSHETGKKVEAKKTESHWHKKETGSRKMEAKKTDTHTNMTGQKPPHAGMVWVNTNSKVYHSSGSKYYGKTKHGKWMTAADARKAGYKASKN